MSETTENAYSICRSVVGAETWTQIMDALPDDARFEEIPDLLAAESACAEKHPYVADLARLELAAHRSASAAWNVSESTDHFELNPTLEVVPLQWDLCENFRALYDGECNQWNDPEPAEQWILTFRRSEDADVRIRPATENDLLAIKIAAEEQNATNIATSDTPPAFFHSCMMEAAKREILIAPPSRIRRAFSTSDADAQDMSNVVHTFTLQWHVTNRCDLNCEHCYDRSERSPLDLDTGRGILDDLGDFCIQSHVGGHVCFSGGNPFLYPDFFELYESAVERGFSTSILANPVSREKLQKLIAIRRPNYFQISLEGLQQHNDSIRGEGTYRRALKFLDLLDEMNVSSSVMLTLTRDNIDQVIELGDILDGRADYFTFNRLSPVGQGSSLLLPSQEDFEQFLRDYVKAAEDNPVLGFKDNLINVVLDEQEKDLFRGCTGFGCGAAFNFLAVLPDGEVHACRKFPSPVGNVHENDLATIYASDKAEQYRRGAAGCDGCDIRQVCGGCLASASGHGLDIFQETDPFCFYNN